MKIREKSFLGVAIKLIWVVSFTGIFTVLALSWAGFCSWVVCLLGLIITSALLGEYVR